MEKAIEDILVGLIDSFFGKARKLVDKLNPKSSRPKTEESNSYLENKEKSAQDIDTEFKSYIKSIKKQEDIFSGNFKKLNNGSSEGDYLWWSYNQYKNAAEYFKKNKKNFSEEERALHSSYARNALDTFVREMYKTFRPSNKEYFKDPYFTKEFEKYFPKGTGINKSPKNYQSRFNIKDEDLLISVDPVSLDCNVKIKGKNSVYTDKISAEDFYGYSTGKIKPSFLVEKYFSNQLNAELTKEQFKPYLDSLKDKTDVLTGDMSLLPRGAVYFEYNKYKSLRDELGRWAANGNPEIVKTKQNETLDAFNNFLGLMRKTMDPLNLDAKYKGIYSDFIEKEMDMIKDPKKFSINPISQSNKQKIDSGNSLAQKQTQSQNLHKGFKI